MARRSVSVDMARSLGVERDAVLRLYEERCLPLLPRYWYGAARRWRVVGS